MIEVQKVKDKDIPCLLRYVKEMLETIGEDGETQWSFFFDAKVAVVTHKAIKYPQEYGSSAQGLVLEAVIDLKKRGCDDPKWTDFESALERVIEAYLRTPLRTYNIFFPLNATGPYLERKRWFNILDTRFRRVTWRCIKKFPGWDRFQRDIEPSKRRQILSQAYFTPLITSLEARSIKEAFSKANRNFELLRAILNLTFQFGKITYQSGRPKSLGKVLPPPIYGVFSEGGDFENSGFTIEQYEYKWVEIASEQFRALEWVLKQLEKSDPKMCGLLTDILLKYGQAMDTTNWRHAFLALWQVLETIAQPTSTQLKMDDVAKRIGLLLKQDPLIRDLLDYLKDLRNTLVHKGRFSEEGLEEVNFLKFIVEQAINTVLLNLRRFSTPQMLEEFYVHASLCDSSLKTKVKVINAILHNRNR